MTEQKQLQEKKEEAKEKMSETASKEQTKQKIEQKPVLHRKITVNGKDLPISTKHAIAICRFIKDETVSEAISMLQDVLKFKRAILMRGELPHRKGMCSGRYPINATKQFIKLLKNLNANASNLGIDSLQLIIHAKANIASRRRFSRRARHFKRTDVFIELKQNGKVSETEKKVSDKQETKE